MVKKLIEEEPITTETRLDFNKTFSAWLVKQGFERKEDRFTSNPVKVRYTHKELPIALEPRNNEVVFFGNLEMSFTELVFVNKQGEAQTSVFRGRNPVNGVKLLEELKDKYNKAIELAQKIVEHIRKGDYL